jgi:hypothetical protein
MINYDSQIGLWERIAVRLLRDLGTQDLSLKLRPPKSSSKTLRPREAEDSVVFNGLLTISACRLRVRYFDLLDPLDPSEIYRLRS